MTRFAGKVAVVRINVPPELLRPLPCRPSRVVCAST